MNPATNMQVLSALFFGATLVAAHGYVDTATIGGQVYQFYQPYVSNSRRRLLLVLASFRVPYFLWEIIERLEAHKPSQITLQIAVTNSKSCRQTHTPILQ